MAKSTSQAEFDQLLAQDPQTFLASRGAKSQFSELELDPGDYFAQLVETDRGVFDMEAKDADGKGTGVKVRTRRVQIKTVIIADANPRCLPGDLERWAGQTPSITFLLPTGDKEASDRMMAVLGQIGIPTEQFVTTERDIKDPNTQLTLAQGLQMIDEEKPFAKLAVSLSKGRKYLNFRSLVKQEEIEALLGHPIESNIVAGEQAPFEEAPADDQPPMTWSDEHSLWNIDGTDEWIDEHGNPVDSPIVKSAPRRPPTRATAPATKSVTPTVTSTPGARRTTRR